MTEITETVLYSSWEMIKVLLWMKIGGWEAQGGLTMIYIFLI